MYTMREQLRDFTSHVISIPKLPTFNSATFSIVWYELYTNPNTLEKKNKKIDFFEVYFNLRIVWYKLYIHPNTLEKDKKIDFFEASLTWV